MFPLIKSENAIVLRRKKSLQRRPLSKQKGLGRPETVLRLRAQRASPARSHTRALRLGGTRARPHPRRGPGLQGRPRGEIRYNLRIPERSTNDESVRCSQLPGETNDDSVLVPATRNAALEQQGIDPPPPAKGTGAAITWAQAYTLLFCILLFL